MLSDNDGLIVALLDDGRLDGRRTRERIKDLTETWLRFKYQGRIITGASVDEILAGVGQTSHTACLILTQGTMVMHAWNPALFKELEDWARDRAFLAAGDLSGDGLAPGNLLINLREYVRLGRPVFGVAGEEMVGVGDANGLAVQSLPASVRRALLQVAPATMAQDDAWAGMFGDGIKNAKLSPETMGEGQMSFLNGIQRQIVNCQNGVFIWNFEAYDDVQPDAPNGAPVSSVYSVAAGLKTNWILHAHGFSDETRIVYFDYSERALAFKRFMRETWNGTDYPAFARSLIEAFGMEDTFYQLWDGMSPQNLDWDRMEELWRRELAVWGGADAFKASWERIRALEVEYVHADVCEQLDRILSRVRDEDNAVIWWSNVFFSFFSNWYFPGRERERIYRNWISGLVAKCPTLRVYGKDHLNGESQGRSVTDLMQVLMGTKADTV